MQRQCLLRVERMVLCLVPRREAPTTHSPPTNCKPHDPLEVVDDLFLVLLARVLKGDG